MSGNDNSYQISIKGLEKSVLPILFNKALFNTKYAYIFLM